MRTRKPVQDARDAVTSAREVLARWEAERAAATAELASLQSRAGSEVLDDPNAASTLPRLMTQLRDRSDIARRAIEAQQPRVVEAERAYLLAEADQLEQIAATARATLEKHEARTAELLRALEKHEGPFVPKALLDDTVAIAGQERSWEHTPGETLRKAVESAERPVLALREMAAGRNPMAHPDLRDHPASAVLPDCVTGPDALVRAQRGRPLMTAAGTGPDEQSATPPLTPPFAPGPPKQPHPEET